MKFMAIKILAQSFLIALVPLSASAFSSLGEQASYFQSLYGNPSGPTSITKTTMNKGETRPKAVLRGVFYFGGSDRTRDALSSSYQKLLCENGFSEAFSVYNSTSGGVSCDGNILEYSRIGQAKKESDGGSRVAGLMKDIYNIVKANGGIGPIYLHCYYGVHASNTISQMVLKQFCGIDNATALSNWDKVNIYNSLEAANVVDEKEKITTYQVNPSLQINSAERAVICYH